MKLYTVRLPENLPYDLYETVLSRIDEQKKNQIKGYLKREDSLRSLISYVLIRYILCKNLNKKITDIAIERNEFGKPYIIEGGNIEFNISHSADYIVLVIDEYPIGIDVEKIKDINYLNISKRFFSDYEYNTLTKQDKSKQLTYFYDLWTLKESYIKAVGKGLSIPLNSFSIIKYNNEIILDNNRIKPKYYFKQYSIDSEYILSVCAVGCEFCENVKELDCEGLLKEYLSL